MLGCDHWGMHSKAGKGPATRPSVLLPHGAVSCAGRPRADSSAVAAPRCPASRAGWPGSSRGLSSSTKAVPPSACTHLHPQHYLQWLRRNHGPTFKGTGDLDLKTTKGTSQNPCLQFFAGVSPNLSVVKVFLPLVSLFSSPHTCKVTSTHF